MKIIISGAGITGLTTYIFLRRYLPDTDDHEILLVEAYDVKRLEEKTKPGGQNGEFMPTETGSALGLAKNGLGVLRRLDGEIRAGQQSQTFDGIMRRGFPVTQWGFDCARGWRLSRMRLCRDIPSSGRGWDSKVVDEIIQSKDLGPMLLIERKALWEELRDAAYRAAGRRDVILHKKVVGVEFTSDDPHPITVSFADGSLEKADLVIGADGLRSAVRKAMFSEEMEKDGVDYVTAKYEGLAGVGGWLPGSVFKSTPGVEPNSMRFIFGPTGFMGYGYASSCDGNKDGVGGWWSTFPRPQPPSSQSSSSKIDMQSSIDALLQRHGWWKLPSVKAIMKYIKEHRYDDVQGKGANADGNNSGLSGAGLMDREYGTYTTPPLPTFSKWNGRVILLGDAGHALQTSSGQGASQGFEDAESFSMLLSYYMARANESKGSEASSHETTAVLEKTAKTFESLRKPRISEIYTASQRMGSMKGTMNVVQEFIMYFFLWLMGQAWFWRLLGKDGNDYYKGVLLYDLPGEVGKALERES